MRTLTGVLIILFTTLVARADHEPDHRYEVEGYILDANRQPLANTGVSIRIGNQVIGSARSDSDGFYYIKLHLHDSSIGRKLVLTTPDHSGSFMMTTIAGDTTTRRQHFVNLIGDKLEEGQLDGIGAPTWRYIAGALLGVIIVAGGTAIGLKKRRKRARKQSQQASQGKHSKKRKHRRKR